jgi:hypothetical protein
LTTGGMVEPRADWTDHGAPASSRRSVRSVMRGGKITIIEHETNSGRRYRSSLTLSGLTSSTKHRAQIFGDYLPTKRGRGLD